MSSVADIKVRSPNKKEETCAMFTIDTDKSYIMSNLKVIKGEVHTLSFWIKSDTGGSVTACGNSLETGTEWKRFIAIYKPETDNVQITFGAEGRYYIYHPKLEAGNKPTDWSPNPEDVDAWIQAELKVLNDQIDLKVSEKDINGDYLIGKINLTSTTALIAAKYIDLEGAVTIKSLSQDTTTKIEQAACTATNFLEFDPDSDEGLLIGYKVDDEWSGTRAQILSDSFNVLDENGDLSSKFGSKLIQLGVNSDDAVIEMCGGSGYIKSYEDAIGTEWKRLLIGAEHSVGLKSTGDIELDTDYADPVTGMNVSTSLHMISSRPWYGGLYSGEILMAVNYKGDDIAGSTGIDMQYDGIDIFCEGSGTSRITLKREGSINIDGYVKFNAMPTVNSMYIAPVCSGRENMGSITVASGGYTDVEVEFPFKFVSNPNVIATLYSNGTAAAIGGVEVVVLSRTTSSAILRVFNNSGAQRTPGLFWIATQN